MSVRVSFFVVVVFVLFCCFFFTFTFCFLRDFNGSVFSSGAQRFRTEIFKRAGSHAGAITGKLGNSK